MIDPNLELKVPFWPEQFMLLLLLPSRVLYQTQVGGNFCYSKEAKGVAVPVAINGADAAADHVLALNELLDTTQHHVDESIAEELDQMLRDLPIRGRLELRRDKLEESLSAWIHVTVESLDLVTGCEFPVDAILVWPNPKYSSTYGWIRG